MRRLNVAAVILIILALPVSAQQDPLSSQYMFNTLTFNPGYAGINGMVCATALNRQQWVGFNGAPATTTFNVCAPFKPFKINSGVGLLVQSDNIGFDKDISLAASYSYHMEIGQGLLGIGISAGMLNTTINPTWEIPSGDSHTPASGDPLIPENKESYVAFDAGLGLYYNTDKYYAALSVTHINQPRIKYSKGEAYISRHYYLTAGYTLQLPNPALELLPSLFVQTDAKAYQFSATSLIRYNKKVWGGVAYRYGDSFIAIVGLELLNGLRLGYSYDFTMSDMGKTSNGSHEFMVNYCFDLGLGKSAMKYKSIRFL